jgi:amidase
MTPLGLGNDIGGSLRSPAFCNGVVGFRPTMHRVPEATSIAPSDGPLCAQMMATDGPMARTVADIELAMGLLNGADPRDPLSVDVALARPPFERRAALCTTGLGAPLHASIVDGARRGANALADAGWEIEETELPEFEAVFEVWNRIMADDIAGLLAVFEGELDPRLLRSLSGHVTYDYARPLPPGVAVMERRRLMRVWSEQFARTPVILTPVWPDPQFPGDTDLELGIDFVARMLQFATPAPLLGLPALAVPTGVIDGLPTGVQIHADRWNDTYCLAAGAEIEARTEALVPPLAHTT